jgi:SAM-dependent MidA family methyltransferase
MKRVDPAWFPDEGYCSEVQRHAQGFISSLAAVLRRGAALFVDYGFPRHEYYHPQRTQGTLRCHYRHRAHDDPLFLPGLQDITSHIDFTAIAEAGVAGGLELLGYTSQAQFLINCGITDLVARTPPDDARAYLPFAAQAQKLTSPAEMGELFKVIALGKGIAGPLLGFRGGDRRHTL